MLFARRAFHATLVRLFDLGQLHFAMGPQASGTARELRLGQNGPSLCIARKAPCEGMKRRRYLSSERLRSPIVVASGDLTRMYGAAVANVERTGREMPCYVML